MVANGSGITMLVATNAATELPTYLSMALMSIDTIFHALYVLVSAAEANSEKIQGRGRDFAIASNCWDSQTQNYGKRAYIFTDNYTRISVNKRVA